MIWKVDEFFPAVTTIEAGTDTVGSLLDSKTVKPPDGAGALVVTVPVEVLPPLTLDGFSVNELTPKPLMVS